MRRQWHFTMKFTLDMTIEEPHMQSFRSLSNIYVQLDVIYTWRIKHPLATQYTWVNVVDGRMSAARLDRIYMSPKFRTIILARFIYPMGFTDHHVFIQVWRLTPTGTLMPSFYKTENFVRDFMISGLYGGVEIFNLCLWVNGGRCRKPKYSFFWQQYTAHCTAQYTSHSTIREKTTVYQIEQEIMSIQGGLMNHNVSEQERRLIERKR